MNADESLLQFLIEIKDNIIQNHLAAGQNVTGKTIESYEVQVADGVGRLLAAPWVQALDQGRGPTRNQTAGNPTLKQVILDWMAAKGIHATPYARRDGTLQDQLKADQGLAYIIARKIHQDGTKIYREGGTGVISNVITDQRIKVFIDVFAQEYLNTDLTLQFIKGFTNAKT